MAQWLLWLAELVSSYFLNSTHVLVPSLNDFFEKDHFVIDLNK